MTDHDKKDPPSFWRVIAQSIIEGEKHALRVARGGAIVGALLGAGAGIYFFEYFGWMGIRFGLIAGAVAGGVGLWLIYWLAWPSLASNLPGTCCLQEMACESCSQLKINQTPFWR